jgi:hypothetical protein
VYRKRSSARQAKTVEKPEPENKIMGIARLLVLGLAIVALASAEAPSWSADKKDNKKDGKDYSGVITEVRRDGDKKDNDLGFFILRVGNDSIRITVMKNTEVMNNGKEVGFKALDKGDRVTVHARIGQPHVADRIVIRKN